MKLGVIIPAAGRGSRMQREDKKQFIELADKPVLYYTLKAFQSWRVKISQLNVMVTEEDINYCKNEVLSGLDFAGTPVRVLAGGRTRRETVRLGLAALDVEVEQVLIHDGARLFVSHDLIARVLKALEQHQAVTAAVPVKDTIKKVNSAGLVEETLDRDSLRAVQTPQAFSCELLTRAHDSAGPEVRVNDDASLVELLGAGVYVVAGEERNFKLTTPQDLARARFLLEEVEKKTFGG